MTESWSVYIALLKNGKYYVGMTQQDPEVRLERHQRGVGGTYAGRLEPQQILYREAFASAGAARKREKQLKGWSHAKKQALIDGNVGRLKELARSRRA